jgi:predicted dehydrogenase
MGIVSLIKGGSEKKVRYAVVGLGDISQEAMMPALAQTGNSEITALVTSDPEKAEKLGERYGVSAHFSYEEFPELLRSGKIDAIYLATPNWRHAEFAVPALEAGVHVLMEKPMEVSTAKCREILEAQKKSGAKLMVAYRLHFEPATLSTIEMIRAGELGEVNLFNATFCQMVDPENHRARHGVEAGPLFDMAPYPVNAARYVFGDEPVEVVAAAGVRHPEAGLGELDDTISATLRFPNNRLAQFVVSYYGSSVDSFFAVGTEGSIQMNPAFGYGKPLEQHITINEKKSHKAHKATDQFAGELSYFSECILENKDPEPDGEEGYADVRVLEGIVRALESGKAQRLEPFTRSRRIDTKHQEERFSQKSHGPLVNAKSPSIQELFWRPGACAASSC